MSSKIFALHSPEVMAEQAAMLHAREARALRFRAVFEAPTDLARRRVLADWLLEQGDPHGEFISLQFDSSRTARQRAAKLLKRHRVWFLGPLAPYVLVDEAEQWSHGFISVARMHLNSRLVDEPSLATLTRIEVESGDLLVLNSVWLKGSSARSGCGASS